MIIIHMGLNTLYGENVEETNRLVNEIKDGIEKEGEVSLSWSCDGRTRHFWQSEQWESHLEDKYDFDIGYNYHCKVTKRDDSTKFYIEMIKGENDIWIGKELINNKILLNLIEEKVNEGLRVILRFPQLDNEYHKNIIFLSEDVNNTIANIDFIRRGRTKVVKTDEGKNFVDFLIGC